MEAALFVPSGTMSNQVGIKAHTQPGDELLCALYEDESVSPVTLRAELARLRRLLGPGLLDSRPYRLTTPVESDVAVVERRLGTGAVTAAASAYTGPLLPGSGAPAVVRLRRRLADGLRAALIARRDPDLLADWAHAPWGEEDLDVWRALATVRPRMSTASQIAMYPIGGFTLVTRLTDDREEMRFPLRQCFRDFRLVVVVIIDPDHP